MSSILSSSTPRWFIKVRPHVLAIGLSVTFWSLFLVLGLDPALILILFLIGVAGLGAFWLTLKHPRLALFGILLWAQFGPLLTKITGSRLFLYATYIMPFALLVILLVRSLLLRQALSLPRSTVAQFVILFLFILLIQCINPIVPRPEMALNDLFAKYLLHMSGFFLSIWLIKTPRDLKWVFAILLASGALAALYGFYQYLVGYPYFEDLWALSGTHEIHGVNVYTYLDRRVLSTLLYSATYGLFAAVCAYAVIPLLTLARKNLSKLILIGIAFMVFSGVLLTLTRGVWVAVFGSIALLALLRWNKILRANAINTFISLAILFVVALAIIQTGPVRYRLETLRYAFSEQYEARFINWLRFWLPKMADWHLITGYGLGLVGAGAERYLPLRVEFWGGRSGITDNLYVNMFVSTGLFGLLIFLILICLSLRSSYRLSRKLHHSFLRAVAMAIFLIFVMYYISFMSADHLTDSYPTNFYYWVLLGILCKLPRLDLAPEEVQA